NCYLLFLALLSMIPFVISISGEYVIQVLLVAFLTVMTALLITPFSLIHNGIVMIKKEGRCAAHLLSLGLGVAVLVGEVLLAFNVIYYSSRYGLEATEAYTHSITFLMTSIIIITVVYGSMAFLIFMLHHAVVPELQAAAYEVLCDYWGAGLVKRMEAALEGDGVLLESNPF
ncbi:MAG: hypothetical protein IJ441_05540, partial [Spirochaetaceae bacterium]|nr:hypothetical protein [Spirochaetaceae bacterium]